MLPVTNQALHITFMKRAGVPLSAWLVPVALCRCGRHSAVRHEPFPDLQDSWCALQHRLGVWQYAIVDPRLRLGHPGFLASQGGQTIGWLCIQFSHGNPLCRAALIWLVCPLLRVASDTIV